MTETVFSYPGGKMNQAKRITSSLPAHTAYVEVFGGSGAVLFNKEVSDVEIYNDLDGDIPHFFRVLRDHGEELQEYLRCVEFSKALYDRWTRMWYQGWRPNDDVKRAAVFIFNRYVNWGGKYQSLSGFMRSSPQSCRAKPYYRKVEDLHRFQDRLNETAPGWPDEFEYLRDRHRGVLIDNLDYRTIFEKYDSDNSDGEGAVFYCDPPYMDTEHYYSGSSEGFDHREFAERIQELDGDWIVSYGSEVPDELQGYRTESVEVYRQIDCTDENRKTAHERLIMSYPESRQTWAVGHSTGDALDTDW